MTTFLEQGLTGWSYGYQSIVISNKEAEIKQGKNYVFGALFQTMNISLFNDVISVVSTSLLKGRVQLAASCFNWTVRIIQFPVVMLAAISEQGKYRDFAEFLNDKIDEFNRYQVEKFPRLHVNLPHVPLELSPTTEKALHYVQAYSSRVVYASLVVSGVALAAFGNPAFGYSILGALLYQYLDSKRLIPDKISLYMEKYMHTFSAIVVALFSSSIILKTMIVLALGFNVPFKYRLPIYQFIDKMVRSYLEKKDHVQYRPYLAEYDAPVHQKENFTFEEIKEILEGENSDFKLNPAHFTKVNKACAVLKTDYDFEKLLPLYDQIAPKNLAKQLRYDENFMTYLGESVEGADKKKLNIHFVDKESDLEREGYVKRSDYIEQLVSQLAEEKKQSVNLFLQDWVGEQLKILVGVLSGKRAFKGTRVDLEMALPNCAKIVSYLTQIAVDGKHKVEFEDKLLKLAIEGGDYCTRGIKRCSTELVDDISQRHQPDRKGLEPYQMYEARMEASLENQRLRLTHSIFERFKVNLKKSTSLPADVTDDVHFFDLYRLLFSYGLVPMSDDEKYDIGMPFIYFMIDLHPLRKQFFKNYDPNETIEEDGELDFTEWLRGWLGSNKELDEEQREDILDAYTRYDDPEKRLHRLLLMKLGVITKIKERA